MKELLVLTYVIAALLMLIGGGRAFRVVQSNYRLFEVAERKGVDRKQLITAKFGFWEGLGFAGAAWLLINIFI